MVSRLFSTLSFAARLRLLQAISLLSFAISAPSIAAQCAMPSTITVSGRVLGGSGRHTVYVALWDENGFLARPVEQRRFKSGEVATFRFEIPPGRWALSAFEDINGNGVLDMGAFGPKEPSGFWRRFHGWRKPKFDDVAVKIDRDMAGADIALSR